MKGFTYKEPQGVGGRVQAAQIEFLDQNVRFSLRHCSTRRDHCISNVASDKAVLQALYNQLGKLESMTWQQARGIDHRKGISIESKSGPNHKLLAKDFNGFDTFGHFRVNVDSKPKFRVFGTLQEDCFCILRFDVDGKLNH